MSEGKVTEALVSYQTSLKILESLAADAPASSGARHDLAVLYAKLGQANAVTAQKAAQASDRTAQWREARGWYQRSLAMWQDLRNRGMTSGTDMRRCDEAQAEINRCDAALAKR